VLNGLTVASLKAKRLTAASSLARADQGAAPAFGGQTFADVTCKIGGTETFETLVVSSGSATFSLAASEALVVYF